MADNVLAKISGENLGALLALPDVATHPAETAVAEFDAANLGRVRVTFTTRGP